MACQTLEDLKFSHHCFLVLIVILILDTLMNHQVLVIDIANYQMINQYRFNFETTTCYFIFSFDLMKSFMTIHHGSHQSTHHYIANHLNSF